MALTKNKSLTPWRKLALVTWKNAGDPSVYGSYEFDATYALAFIKKYNHDHNARVTLTHFVAKAIAVIIEKYPAINGVIKWGQIYQRDTVDMFLQVAIEDKKNVHRESLSGAKISNINKKSLKEISVELSVQATDIRGDNDPQFQKTFNIAKLLPVWLLRPLVQIHGFAVFNLGLNLPSLGIFPDPFGSAMLTSVGSLGTPPGFAPLVPPSRVPLLICLGRVEDKPWVVDGKVTVRPVAGYTATFDHRFMDGLMASRLFKMFMEILREPGKYLG